MIRITLLMTLAILLYGTTGAAVEGVTPELGKTLFEATTLGSNGKSCASCHPGGKGLEEIGAYTEGQLREMINFCIRDALHGRMLSLESQEIEAMLRYLRELHPR